MICICRRHLFAFAPRPYPNQWHPIGTRLFSADTKHDPITELESGGSSEAMAPLQFDTLAFVQRLEDGGLTRQQSEAILKCLADVIEETIGNINENLIPQSERDQTIRAYQSDFAHLKSEIRLLERNDFTILKQENERIVAEVEKLKSKMREDLQRLQAGVRLDMNLDKSRVRDEQNALLAKIKQTESKLETEISQMRTGIDNVRLDTIKTIGAAATSIGFVVLGWVRYFRS